MVKSILIVFVLVFGNLTEIEPIQKTAFAYTPAAESKQIAASNLSASGKKIPILMYHEVSDKPWGHEYLYVKPKEFKKQLQYLKKRGFQTITFEDFDYIENFSKPILLTFDDGYSGNYDVVFPLLKQYHMKATIFLVTDLINTDKMLTASQIKEMSASGLVSFQSHTTSHYFLGKVTDVQLLKEELERPIGFIEKLTGRKPIAFAYPYGDYTSDVVEQVKKYYQYGLSVIDGIYQYGDDPYTMKRIAVNRDTTFEEFKNFFKT